MNWMFLVFKFKTRIQSFLLVHYIKSVLLPCFFNWFYCCCYLKSKASASFGSRAWVRNPQKKRPLTPAWGSQCRPGRGSAQGAGGLLEERQRRWEGQCQGHLSQLTGAPAQHHPHVEQSVAPEGNPKPSGYPAKEPPIPHPSEKDLLLFLIIPNAWVSYHKSFFLNQVTPIVHIEDFFITPMLATSYKSFFGPDDSLKHKLSLPALRVLCTSHGYLPELQSVSSKISTRTGLGTSLGQPQEAFHLEDINLTWKFSQQGSYLQPYHSDSMSHFSHRLTPRRNQPTWCYVYSMTPSACQ